MVYNMKNKIDLLIINIGFALEFIAMVMLKYAQYLYFINPEEITISKRFFNNIEANTTYICGYYILLIFYSLAIMYIAFIICSYNKKHIICLKRNTIRLLILLFGDIIIYGFDFKNIIIYSFAFKFVIICLLTNLVVYIKYKKNNIKIK